MKKNKLALHSLKVKSFTTATSQVKGGTLVLTEHTCIEESVNFCPTIHYTICGLRPFCEFYSGDDVCL